jgi:TAT-translocated FGD2 family F420-dependent dehydrogenase
MPKTSLPSSRLALSPERRNLLKWTTAAAGVSLTAGMSSGAAAQPSNAPPSGGAAVSSREPSRPAAASLQKGMFSFMLAHEQFTPAEILSFGALASRSGFHVLSSSDHFQPWQANQGHSSQAWIVFGALGAQVPQSWMGTTVTCPTFRYEPAVVAQSFATLGNLYPGRVFLGVGSGEALNEQSATGEWPKWPERWDRLIEAMSVIRQLWTGEQIAHEGKYYTVNARLYDPPAKPIPLLAAANGRKSMRLAGMHADGLVSDPKTWKQYKGEWEAGARAAGKDPSTMPVLIEHYVVVGGEDEAKQAAELWRFGPNAFKTLYNVRDPAEIQRKADAETPLDAVYGRWPIGMDPAVHVKAVQELFDSGATIVNIHSGQHDQKKVIEFYGTHVLPKFRDGRMI